MAQLLFSSLLFSQGAPEPPRPGSSKWGPTDQRGAANLLTAEKVLEAVRLVKTGKVYHLGRLYEEGFVGVGRQHRNFVNRLRPPEGPFGTNKLVALEEDVYATLGQVGTQLDGLGHVGIGDVFYNGIDRKDIQTYNGLTKLGIENVGAFVTPGVLLDIAALKGVQQLEKSYEITVDDLKEAIAKEKVTIRPGDVVLINTGWGSLWSDQDKYTMYEPGIGIPAAQWLVEQQICMVGADNYGGEVHRMYSESPHPTWPVHQILMTLNGVYNLENIDTSEIARDRVYRFAFIYAPLRLKGFTGSPGDPIAIR
jgi:kynurenine formamidase